jgi:hypothetical protein
VQLAPLASQEIKEPQVMMEQLVHQAYRALLVYKDLQVPLVYKDLKVLQVQLVYRAR